jgi:hypothetical protein
MKTAKGMKIKETIDAALDSSEDFGRCEARDLWCIIMKINS